MTSAGENRPAECRRDIRNLSNFGAGGACPANQSLGEDHVERMPRAVRHNVADEIDPAEREITDEIEHFVAGRLVGVSKFVVDEAVRAEHE